MNKTEIWAVFHCPSNWIQIIPDNGSYHCPWRIDEDNEGQRGWKSRKQWVEILIPISPEIGLFTSNLGQYNWIKHSNIDEWSNIACMKITIEHKYLSPEKKCHLYSCFHVQPGFLLVAWRLVTTTVLHYDYCHIYQSCS